MTASALKFYQKGHGQKYAIPEPKILMDVFPQRKDIIKIEPLRKLPLGDESISSIVIDLPFVISPRGCPSSKKEDSSLICKRFSSFYPASEMYENYYWWISESYRVLEQGGICVFKCQSTISGSIEHSTEEFSFMCANRVGFYTIDKFYLLARTRLIASSKIKKQVHARKYTSVFFVFKKDEKLHTKTNYYKMIENYSVGKAKGRSNGEIQPNRGDIKMRIEDYAALCSRLENFCIYARRRAPYGDADLLERAKALEAELLKEYEDRGENLRISCKITANDPAQACVIPNYRQQLAVFGQIKALSDDLRAGVVSCTPNIKMWLILALNGFYSLSRDLSAVCFAEFDKREKELEEKRKAILATIKSHPKALNLAENCRICGFLNEDFTWKRGGKHARGVLGVELAYLSMLPIEDIEFYWELVQGQLQNDALAARRKGLSLADCFSLKEKRKAVKSRESNLS